VSRPEAEPDCCSLISHVPLMRFHGVARIRYGGKAWYLVDYCWCTTPPPFPTHVMNVAPMLSIITCYLQPTQCGFQYGGEVHSRGRGAFTAVCAFSAPPPALKPRGHTTRNAAKDADKYLCKKSVRFLLPFYSGDRRAQAVDWLACGL